MNAAAPQPTLAQATRVWARIGLLSFGGPAAQIALMHRELVDSRRWLSDGRFLHALNYCMLLPGPEAQQLAVYIGWLMHRTAGGLIAGVLFVLPGFATILALSILYAGYGNLPWVEALFYGIKAAVLAIVAEAVVRIGKRALQTPAMVALAALAFVAIHLFHVPFPAIVAAAAVLGLIGHRVVPHLMPRAALNDAGIDRSYLADALIADGRLAHIRPDVARTAAQSAVWLTLWLAPVAALVAALGPDHVFARIGVFFSQAAVVTFGGAYAVLAYIAQQAVQVYGWLTPGEMLDGLALAETTPGPLIMVTQFVGYLAAARGATGLDPLWAGIAGAALTTWVTFAPCFLWIFAGAPYIEALRGNARLNAALSCITAAVVGVILNLTIWFTLRVVFNVVEDATWGPVTVSVPEPGSLDPAALVIALASLIAVLRFHAGIGATLLAAAVAGFVWRMVLS
ncbi:MAG: chromate efflux transporter [Rhodospirillaceae bacterium]|nr:chromate efflux transporter [Rhodospirillaceae bacterium]